MEARNSLTFDDVLLLPGFSKVLPSEVSLSTRLTKKIKMNIPLVSAAMDTVTEANTAIAMAREGGIGVIHRNLGIKEQAEQVKKVKTAEFWVITSPVMVTPEDTVERTRQLREEHGIGSFPVVRKGKLVGIVTGRDLLFEDAPGTKIKDVMTKDLITVDKVVSTETAKEIMHKHRIEKLPVVDKNGNLKGLMTLTDIRSKEKFPNALKDPKGRLIVAAAIGPNDLDRAKALVEQEVDCLVVDTSHGHSKGVIDGVKIIKKRFDVELIAGNVATAKATEALISAGADGIKVGVGPGSICTTRIISGVGVPQFTAVMECSKAAETQDIPIIADGGIKYSGDITKALAAGASSVMLGGLFAGCEETPGKIVYMRNRKFKQYRGMGSISAMKLGSAERYFQKALSNSSKLVPEGIEGVVPFKGNIGEIVFQLMGGLRSGMGLVGAADVSELRAKTNWIRISPAGLKESHPHDVTITEESPNYPSI